jgi:carbonic anhydrase
MPRTLACLVPQLRANFAPCGGGDDLRRRRTSKTHAFVDAVARKNVEITMADIRKDSPVLTEMESNGVIKIAGAMYNLENGVVDFFAE